LNFGQYESTVVLQEQIRKARGILW